MKENVSPSACGADIWVQAHLGRKLRELFEGLPEALPSRLVELLNAREASTGLVVIKSNRNQINQDLHRKISVICRHL
jgi:hypothetical protein